MGYIKHHAIAITGHGESFTKAHVRAVEIFGATTTEVIASPLNSYKSFFIAPDGSKEGWEDSNTGDINRAEFIDFIEHHCNGISYCVFFYGEDNGNSEVVDHN